ncbi:MAG: indole-3-glycerol phosphate synthase TrpC [Mariniphaga sp.]
MNILEKIIETKKLEVKNQKKVLPEVQLKSYPGYKRECNSLKLALSIPDTTGIIAEFKQKSPSKGEINFAAKVEEVTREYAEAGAAGLSVLTDYEYFGGTLANLAKAREANPKVPILRKDFIIDPWQITEAKAFGADVILLIAACLEKKQAEMLAKHANAVGMEVLMEVHHAEELKKVNDFVDMVGINNRDLKTFKVDVETSVLLGRLIPGRYVKISESGISDAATIRYLKENDFSGFLIGEAFMKSGNPGEACRRLISELKKKNDSGAQI